MKTKKIIVATLLVLILSLSICFGLKPKIAGQSRQSEAAWQKYSSSNFGLELEYPSDLKPYPTDAVYFAESEDSPGLINISTERVDTKSLETAIAQAFSPAPKKIGEIIVNGRRAVITVSGTENPDNTSDKTLFLIHNNLLYRIFTRGIDEKRFWQSIRFTDNL